MNISSLVSSEAILSWVIIFCFVGYFVYREWPEFKRRVSSGATKEQLAETEAAVIAKRLDKMETRMDVAEEKLANDFARLNSLVRDEDRNKKMFKQIITENEIIMRAMLGMIEGLQELGANGPTKAAHEEIMNYLQAQAHSTEDLE